MKFEPRFFYSILAIHALAVGILFGPCTSDDQRTAPSRRSEQERQRCLLSDGDYVVTEGAGRFGRTRPNRFYYSEWLEIGDLKLDHVYLGQIGPALLSGAYLRVFHHKDTILRVERRIMPKAMIEETDLA